MTSLDSGRQATIVRSADHRDLDPVGHMLARAFADDPVWTWLVGKPVLPEAPAAAFYRTEMRNRLPYGQVYVTDGCRSAAAWMPPPIGSRETAMEIIRHVPDALRLFRHRLPKALSLLTQTDRHHPKAPHWYLVYLATDPAHQGKGLGSATIQPVLERCDREGEGAYLESSKESNVPFYERHGFKVVERLEAGGCPPFFLMWRDPR